MEHPGKIWNCIECFFNKYLRIIIPDKVLRWLWVLAHTAVAGYIFLGTLAGCLGYIFCIAMPTQKLCQEKIYEATPEFVNPAHEGKLVQLHGMLIPTTPVCDPLTGIQVKFPWLIRQFYPLNDRLVDESPDVLEHIKEALDKTFTAPEWHLGKFRIRNYTPTYYFESETLTADPFCLQDSPQTYSFGKDTHTADAVQFTQPKALWKVIPPKAGESAFLLVPPGTEEPIGFVKYSAHTQPVYIIARQCGNELLLDDPAAYFSTHAPYWNPLIIMEDGTEIFLLIIGGLIHFGILCLILSCLRSACWHATQGKNLLRLPLWQVASTLVGFFCFLYCGVYLLTDDNTGNATGAGLIYLLLAMGLVTFLVRRWLAAAPAQKRE